MDGHVKAHKFNKLRITVVDHVTVVSGPIKIWISWLRGDSIAVQIVVDDGGDSW